MSAAPRALSLPCGLAELVALARRLAPPGLVDEAAWARLERAGDPLPPWACEGALECRLAEDEAEAQRVDFEVCLRGATPRRVEALRARLGPRAERDGAWGRCLALLGAWADPAHPLHGDLEAVWLELDAPAGAAAPVPFPVCTFDAERLHPQGRADPARWHAALSRALAPADADAHGVGAALGRVLHALPPGAQLRHAARRPTSAGDGVRLVLRLPWRGLPELLPRLGWPGHPEALRAQLERLCGPALVHAVNLDLRDGAVGPRVGIEIHAPGPPDADPRWIRLLDALEACGACAPRRRRALEAWGRPAPAAAGEVEVARALLVKAVLAPDAPVRAKAYLPFGPRLVLAAARA